MNKFENKFLTVSGKQRAFIETKQFKTLWFNTGTLCNLTCKNCFMESSPTNDQLSYLSFEEFKNYIDESMVKNYGTKEVGFTGGEPFMNKDIIKMIEYSLKNGFNTLVLTNGMKPMLNKKEQLLNLKSSNLTIRVSIDHYKKEKHELIRGQNSYDVMMVGLKWLNDNDFNYALATRLLWNEKEDVVRKNFGIFTKNNKLNLDTNSKQHLVTFVEMDEKKDTPEITTECWGILKKDPSNIMCSSSRMIVKKKGSKNTSVIACTLLPYDNNFDLGKTLEESFKKIYLNHPHCSKFCVLGGSNCG